jgi:hypothetical protein
MTRKWDEMEFIKVYTEKGKRDRFRKACQAQCSSMNNTLNRFIDFFLDERHDRREFDEILGPKDGDAIRSIQLAADRYGHPAGQDKANGRKSRQTKKIAVRKNGEPGEILSKAE